MNSDTHRKPIILYCDQPTQTQDDSEAEESYSSDFPPCRVGNHSPIVSRPSPVRPRSRYLPEATIRPTQTQNDSEAEESDISDFPPCRVGNHSPIMSRPSPVRPRSRYLPAVTTSSQQFTISHRPLPNAGLGQKNVVNTTTNTKGNRSLHGRPSLKRQGSKVEDPSLANERPFKKLHLIPCDHDDNLQLNVSLRRDVTSIKETLEDMASEVREEIACIKQNLEEISYEAREERDNFSNMLADLLAEIQYRD